MSSLKHAVNVGENKTVLHKGPGISRSNTHGAQNAQAGQRVGVIHLPSRHTDIRPSERGCGGCIPTGPDIPKPSFVQPGAIEGGGMSERKHAIGRIVWTNESGDISRRIDPVPRESDGLRIVSKEEPGRDFAFRRNQVVKIRGKLVLVKAAGLSKNRKTLSGKRRARIDSLWRWDKKATVWQLQIEQSQSSRIDIRAIWVDRGTS